MKTLYSSAFLSIILAFFAILGMRNENIVIVKGQPIPKFSNIVMPDPANETANSLEPITIDIFNTFGCSECRSFGLLTAPILNAKYSGNKEVNVRVHMIPNMDDESQYYPAVGLKCASEYGKYWEMHDKLYSSEEKLNLREVDLIGQELELPLLPFRECLKSGKYDEEIDSEISYAKKENIIQSPTTLIEGYRLYGNQPVENIQKTVNDIIKTREEIKANDEQEAVTDNVNTEEEEYTGNLKFNINE
jgi:protein-disulfide isomerase